MSKILVILEDEHCVVSTLCLISKKYGYQPFCFSCVEDLIENIDVLKLADLFITDFDLCDTNVIPLLKEIRKRKIKVYTVLNSGNPNAIKEIEKERLSDLIDRILTKTENFNAFFSNLVEN